MARKRGAPRARAALKRFQAQRAAKRARREQRRAERRLRRTGFAKKIRGGRIIRRSGDSGARTSLGHPIPKVETKITDKGVSVAVGSKDEQVRAAALEKVQTEEERKQAALLRESRRKTARKSAELQRRALSIQTEQRGVNVLRERARLKRETRQARAGILSRAATGGVTQTSAFKASRIALRSGLQRKIGESTADESRNKLLDQIRSEEIGANLEARLASEQEPVNVFLDETKTKSSTISSTLIRSKRV